MGYLGKVVASVIQGSGSGVRWTPNHPLSCGVLTVCGGSVQAHRYGRTWWIWRDVVDMVGHGGYSGMWWTWWDTVEHGERGGRGGCGGTWWDMDVVDMVGHGGRGGRGGRGGPDGCGGTWWM